MILSFAISLSYSLGPDTKTISTNQFKAMEYVWQQTKDNENTLVISDTYSLLALEYHSNKKIVGGGFPMDKDFNQNIRMRTLKTIEKGGASFEDNLSLITGSDRWFVVLKSEELKKAKSNLAFLATLRNIFGDIEVWEYN